MASKEEYRRYISELIEKDKKNKKNNRLGEQSDKIGYYLIYFSFILMLLASILLLTPIASFYIAYIFGPLIFVSICAGSVIIALKDKLKRKYKIRYIDKIIAFLLKDYKYEFDKDGCIDSDVFDDSQFSKGYDSYDGSDKLVINIPNDDGSESNVNLTLCDLTVSVANGESNSDDFQVYYGVFGYVYFPNEFKCLMSINKKYKKTGVKSQKIILEDIMFNKRFKVYSDNPIETRYILTPDIMQKLLYLDKKMGYVYLILVDNKMYLGFESMDLFELGDMKNEDLVSLFDNIYDEMKIILEIVNEIKNNDKIFKL